MLLFFFFLLSGNKKNGKELEMSEIIQRKREKRRRIR